MSQQEALKRRRDQILASAMDVPEQTAEERAGQGLLTIAQSEPVQSALRGDNALTLGQMRQAVAQPLDPESQEPLIQNALNTAMSTVQAPKGKAAKAALDMSEEARMGRAKKMGFDPETTYYHGTKADIEGFDPKALGASTNAQSAKKAYFFATEPSTASDYANLSKGRRVLREGITEEEAYAPVEALRKQLEQKYGEKFMMPDKYSEYSMAYTPEELASRGITKVDSKDPLVKNYLAESTKADLATQALTTDPKRELLSLEVQKAALGSRGGFSKGQLEDWKKAVPYWEDKLKNFDPDGPAWQKKPEEMQAMIDKAKDKIKNFNRDSTAHKKNWEKEVSAIDSKMEEMRQLQKDNEIGQNVLPVNLKTQNPYVHDFKGQGYRDTPYSEIIDKAKAAGHDSVVFKNTYDPADPENRQLQDIVAVFDPSQVRSKFAEFNPKKAKSGNISAGIGAVGPAAAAAKLSDDEQARRRALAESMAQ